jgi:uncharacterized protein YmfQ (DUF2313 family)
MGDVPKTAELGTLMILGFDTEIGDVDERYRKTLHQLLPPGRAYPVDEGTELDDLLGGLSREMLREEKRLWIAWYEGDPRKTVYLVERWEELLGLPGCDDTADTPAERRAAIRAKIAAQHSGTSAFFISLAATMGYTITITMGYTLAARCGAARCGAARSSGLGTVFRWIVYGTSGTNDAALECLFEEIRPAHTEVAFMWS